MLVSSSISIQRYYDTSIIIPLHVFFPGFKDVLKLNQRYFSQNGIEVIIVSGEQSESDLKSLLYQFPYITWKVLIDKTIDQRFNRSKAINIGIRHAANKYVLILDPDTTLHIDVIYQLRYITENYHNCFALGTILTGSGDKISIENGTADQATYGILLCEKKYLEEICGYDEKLFMRGPADKNISLRLELLGKTKMTVPQATVLQENKLTDKYFSANVSAEARIVSLYNAIFYPNKIAANDEDWGEFNGSIYNWNDLKNIEPVKQLLDTFKESWVSSPGIFSRKYNVICLIQTRNERRHIPEILCHLDHYCDGIILLDDDSDDGSFEHAVSEKLLLKVRKNYKGYFDDLENRNLLLQLGYFFNADWFFFIDADERFDNRYSDLSSLVQDSPFDSILFYIVHLWNDKNYYRKDIPRSLDGLLLRYRMFRNKGYHQIYSPRELHFASSPVTFNANTKNINILLLHYGLMDIETRKRKYMRYSIQDEGGKQQGHGYEYLIDENFELGKVEEIKL